MRLQLTTPWLALALVATPALTQAGTIAPDDVASDARFRLVGAHTAAASPRLGSFVATPLLRVEGAPGLLQRHEFRMSAGMQPAARAADGSLAPGAEFAPSLDTLRATWRYTLYDSPVWAWKVGVTSALRDGGPGLGNGGERIRFGALPLLHVGGTAQFSPRWQFALDADGLQTTRGRWLDIGLRLDYRLSPGFSLYGGWRLAESGGEAEESYGNGASSAANFGVRWRF